LVFIHGRRDHPSHDLHRLPHHPPRHATDEADLIRLAALDSSRVPSGELLVAQLDGNLVAALSVDTGAAIADPFEHTAAIVDSMRAQVRASRAPRPALLPGHLGRALFGRV
jgi:hypothetical protein